MDGKRPPKENLYRSAPEAIEFVRDESNGLPEGPVLRGHFAVFNQPTEIASAWEGNFIEHIAPGAFTKTIQENRAKMRVLFQHGQDPQVGDKPLGPIRDIREDKTGAYYEVPLLDAPYVREQILPGLEAGLYGASFRFKVMKEEWVDEPKPSDSNPRGIPERKILEAQVMEFGPVTFGAYDGATAGVRSLTDEFLGHSEQRTPATSAAADGTATVESSTVEIDVPDTTTTGTEPPHSLGEGIAEASAGFKPMPSRDTPSTDERPENDSQQKEKKMALEDMRARLEEIETELKEIAREFTGQVLDTEARARWTELTAETETLKAGIKETEERQAYLEGLTTPDPATPVVQGTGTYVTKRDAKTKAPDNVFAMHEYHNRAQDYGKLMDLYEEGARKALEGFDYPHERAKKEEVDGHIEGLLKTVDSPTKEIARRILVCGSPTYRKAFWKTVMNQPLTQDEQRAYTDAQMEFRTEAMGLLTGGGIAAVPIQVDPTIIPTSNGVLNPLRQIARVFTTTSYIWQGVTSSGAVAQYQAEAASAINNAGTLVAPTFQPEKVTSFIPFSYELGQDWGSLESELTQQIQDARDTLEATKFALGAGHGSNEPQGLLIGAGTVVATSNGTTGTGFAASDVYLVEAALPPRYLANARWVTSVGVYQKIRQFDTTGGGLFWANLNPGNPPELLGYPAHKYSTVGTSIAGGLVAGAIWGVLGDFSRYLIVDRIGMSVKVIPDLFGGTAAVHFPTGQSGLYAFWRNTAGVVDSNGFRVGTISKGVN